MFASQWKKACLTLSATILLAGSAFAAGTKITVKANEPGITVSPTLYGIFYEEINRAGDGGLYAEMLQNRSFEDTRREKLSVETSEQPGGWELVKNNGAEVSMSLDDSKPLNSNNKHALKITITNAGKGAGVANVGFRNCNEPEKDADVTAKYGLKNGIAVQKGKQYNLSLYARAESSFKGELTVGIQSKDGKMLAEGKVKGSIGADWKKYDVQLKAQETDADAKFVITSTDTGVFYLDMVSLFPQDTFKNRPNGLRADLAQMIVDMKPKFVRFPGGCFVEGPELQYATRWKKTIGDIAERPGHWNMWGYWSNDGFGAFEFLQFCEDIQAEPMYVINCGMSHKEQGIKDKSQYAVNVDEYIQDALDMIEYANGPVDSKWGALRAQAGHPEPFNMKYMEIGNENGGDIYKANYEKFRSAILAKYPEMRLICCEWGGTPKKEILDIIDEHYYNTPDFFFKQANKYDSYNRKGSKVYVGEYAVTRLCGRGNLIGALSEAAFMTGMERNADVVEMGSYAPLFVNPAWERWNPNAIVFDATRAYGTPSYHVQALFGNNKADVILPSEVNAEALPSEPISGTIGVGTWNTQAEYKDIKVTDANGAVLFDSTGSTDLSAWKKGSGKWTVKEGVIKQSGEGEPAQMILDGKKWGDCTLTLKARKTGGTEGFLISFDTKDINDRTWWNIGGWKNTQSALEWGDQNDQTRKNLVVESNKWYDIKIEMKDKKVKCYLDGKLLHSMSRLSSIKPLYVVAGLKKDTHEVIVKVVNGTSTAQETTVEVAGGKTFKSGKAIVLAGEKTGDENSFEEPVKIAPKEEKLDNVSNTIKRTFPPYSVTVLRLQE